MGSGGEESGSVQYHKKYLEILPKIRLTTNKIINESFSRKVSYLTIN